MGPLINNQTVAMILVKLVSVAAAAYRLHNITHFKGLMPRTLLYKNIEICFLIFLFLRKSHGPLSHLFHFLPIIV